MRETFHPPTDYYCESLAPIDEEICALIAKRKVLSENNPGFPSLNLITTWCNRHELNEKMIKSLFGTIYNENNFLDHFQVEPTRFLKYVSILKWVEIESVLYSVTHMKQYNNASVVYIEYEVNNSEPHVKLGHARVELFISPDYQCQQYRGNGQDKGMQYSFKVIPPLPDDVTGLEFRLSIKPFPEIPEMQTVNLSESTVIIK
ncbi:hypothetical protein [Desulfosporosinus nitroreducens]|uniref:hypothetical protein n=1 Tax=Desulfosporosinus nitroreducens TaxID=2018668 RepID=UPI00207C33E5|nr:hypothetical protein [Desulfosporosinus nitroreducens]MCO1602221.1 hypothetical protein [Desulfosporosinus nitroreducens]